MTYLFSSFILQLQTTVFRIMFNFWNDFLAFRSQANEHGDLKQALEELERQYKHDITRKKLMAERRRLNKLVAEKRKKELLLEKRNLQDLLRCIHFACFVIKPFPSMAFSITCNGPLMIVGIT